jgi:hypothetical protein
MLQFPRLREENAGHITVTVPDMPQAEARAILNDLGRGSWLEPGPIGSRNGSQGLFDKFELFL